MNYDTMMVVHDQRLREELQKRSDVRHIVVAPCSSTLGLRLKAVVFLDRPTPAQCASEIWVEAYKDWIDCAVLTRLGPGTLDCVYGRIDQAKSEIKP